MADGMIGRRIADARGRANLTQGELAQRANLERSALAKIETGQRRVSALELAAIADAVRERIEWFVRPVLPAIISHRNLQEPGAPSAHIDVMIEAIAREVEFVVQAGGLQLDNVEAFSRPANAEEAESLAAEARRILEVPAHAPVTNLAESTSRIGLLPFSFDLGPDSADAATMLLQSGGVSVINGTLRVGRRRLALAHEIGHYLVADDYTVDWRISERNDPQSTESMLDRFARSLLLPQDTIVNYWRERRSVDDSLRVSAVRTASHFRVDMATLARRLSEIGSITNAQADQVRAMQTRKSDIVEYNLYVPNDLEPPELPLTYQQGVLRLYRGEAITAERALDLFFDTFDEASLPILPPVDESEIWQFTS